eukprot:scaffold746_cov508-Prasinococcus_capsulatus_cf.AAC.6
MLYTYVGISAVPKIIDNEQGQTCHVKPPIRARTSNTKQNSYNVKLAVAPANKSPREDHNARNAPAVQ